jgi:aryl-alcohol dehydrogenase-like predicted oxidoreductase
VPLAKDQKLAILPWSPLAGGFLSGKYSRENEKPDGARRATLDFRRWNASGCGACST